MINFRSVPNQMKFIWGGSFFFVLSLSEGRVIMIRKSTNKGALSAGRERAFVDKVFELPLVHSTSEELFHPRV